MLSEKQQEIYSALTAETGTAIKLIYPRYGEYRSAFLFCDMDSDGFEEAVVFYESEKDSEGTVRVNIIDTDEKGRYRSVYDHAGAGSGIERVFFTDFGSGKGIRMAIGYTYLTPTEKTLQFYSYSDGILTSEYSEPYYKVMQTDLNNDGSGDVTVINCNNENHQAYVSLISDVGNGTECTSSVMLSSSSLDIPNAVYGMIGSNTPAVFIDEATGSGNISTEIIYCVNGQLRNPAYLTGSSIFADTSRSSGLYSADIDGDGIIEIPTNEPFPGYRDMNEKQYMTEWNVFENYDIVKKYSSFTDAEKGYCFMLPVRWEGQVTLRKDSVTGEAVFYKFNTSLSESRLELLRIFVTSPDNGEQLLNEGYIIVNKGENSCIAAKFAETDDNLLLTVSEVTNNMYLF